MVSLSKYKCNSLQLFTIVFWSKCLWMEPFWSQTTWSSIMVLWGICRIMRFDKLCLFQDTDQWFTKHINLAPTWCRNDIGRWPPPIVIRQKHFLSWYRNSLHRKKMHDTLSYLCIFTGHADGRSHCDLHYNTLAFPQ